MSADWTVSNTAKLKKQNFTGKIYCWGSKANTFTQPYTTTGNSICFQLLLCMLFSYQSSSRNIKLTPFPQSLRPLPSLLTEPTVYITEVSL